MHVRVLRVMLAGLLCLGAVTGCRSATGQTAGQVIDDASITTQVKARLAADEAKTLTRVDVDTENGVVYLNGVVDDPP